MSYDFKVEDVEYVRHGGTPQLARLFRPQGTGPFPIMVELHGGAWCRQDRLADKVIHESLARSGVIVASLDFRQPPAAPYPASFQDIHYGIRWLKSRAAELGSRPDMIGSMGNSSGGHQAMLLAMRAVRSALRRAAAAGRLDVRRHRARRHHVLAGHRPDRPLPLRQGHRGQGQAVPAGGRRAASPATTRTGRRRRRWTRAARPPRWRRASSVQLPPVLYLQGTEDLAHPRPHLDRFVAAYRKAGGAVDLELFDGEGQGFIMRKAGSPASNRALELITEFTLKQLR